MTAKSMEYTQRRCRICGSTWYAVKGEHSTRCPYRTIHKRALRAQAVRP